MGRSFDFMQDLGQLPGEITGAVEGAGATKTLVQSHLQKMTDQMMAPVTGPIFSSLMGEQGIPEDASVQRLAKEKSWKDVGLSIAHEMTKSYGLRYDFEGDQGWSFNAENVKKSWDESKFWTVFDWATLLASPLKLGSAAMKAAKAGSVGNRVMTAAQAGNAGARKVLEGAAPRGIVGRTISAFDDDLARATMVEAKAGATTRFAGVRAKFRSPMADQQMRAIAPLMAELGIKDPGNMKSLANFYLNGHRAELAYAEHLAGAAVKATRGLGKDQSEGAARALGGAWQEAIGAGNLEDAQSMLRPFGEEAQNAFAKTWDMRNHFSERMALQGMGNEQLALFGKEGGQAAADDILSPLQSTEKFFGQVQELVKRESLEGLANSAATGSAQDILGAVGRWDETMLRANGLDPQAKAIAAAGLGEGTEAATSEAMRQLGWQKMGELGFDAGKHGDRWVDPHAAGEISEFFKIHQPGQLDGMMKAIYRGMRVFRSSKTAYNPGTWVVNYLGNIPFYNFATGKLKMAPIRGASLLRRSAKGTLTDADSGTIQRAFQHMVLDSNEMAGINRALEAGDAAVQGGSALTPLIKGAGVGDKKAFQWLDGLASKGEAGYRALDDAWKLEAYMDLEGQALKRMGIKSAKEATEEQLGEAGAWASEQVIKGMPMFNRMSVASETLGKGIPFSNFTTEALRVWKNQLIEKPHLAFLWSHFFTSASLAATVPAGISPDEYAAMKDGLPGHSKSKPHMLLPMKVDGEARVVDLSWFMPLGANLAQAGQQGGDEGLLGPLTAFFDPSSNPIIGAAMLGITGKDPFTGAPAKAPMTQATVGQLIPGVGTGKLASVFEYSMAAAVPPWMPPGYVARNLTESALDQKGPIGQDLEGGLLETMAENFLRLKTYGYTEMQHLSSIKRRESARDDRIGKLWGHYKTAGANGHIAQQEWATQQLRDEYKMAGKDPDAEVMKGMASRNKAGLNAKSRMLLEIESARKRQTREATGQEARFSEQKYFETIQRRFGGQ